MKCFTSIFARIGVLVSLWIGLVAPATQPALAQGQPGAYLGYKWGLEFDYTTNINGIATIGVVLMDAQGTILEKLAVYEHAVYCQPHGSVTVAQGKVFFAPQSYITCNFELHKYLSHAAELHNFLFDINPTYFEFLTEYKQVQWHWYSDPTTPLTLFDHPSIQQTVVADVGLSTLELSTDLKLLSITSQPFKVKNLATPELDISTYNGCKFDSCQMNYSVRPATPGQQTLVGSQIPFEVDNTTITIGQPVLFSWSVGRIFVDPKAWKQGG